MFSGQNSREHMHLLGLIAKSSSRFPDQSMVELRKAEVVKHVVSVMTTIFNELIVEN